MTIDQMTQLPGANMLERRVAEVFTECGLPHIVIDHSEAFSDNSGARWNDINMKLSEGNWDLVYRNNPEVETEKPARGWINPGPVRSRCFPDFSRMTLFTQGRVGILKIDKNRHKTTYKIPKDLYMAHKVIGYKVSLITPLSLEKITRTYGKNHEITDPEKNTGILRYWILIESGQLPETLYAVDFEINNIDNTCIAYRVATIEYDFVRRKFETLTKAWEKYGID